MIIITLAISLILRLISFNQSLWLDEATTALVSKMSLSDIFTKFLPGDFHPPLYYLIMKGWTSLFGYSEISLRIPSVIFALATIYFTYLIGKKLFNKNTGLVASIFVATSGLSIYYSQEARMYGLAMLLVSATFYFFLERKWIIFSILLMFTGMNDYISLFIIPVFFIYEIKYWKKLALSLLPLVIGLGVWFPIFIKQITTGISVEGSNWWNILGTVNFKNIVLIPVKFMFGRIGFDNKSIYLLLVVIFGCLFAYLISKSVKFSKILWLWLILPIAIGIVISFKIPTLTYFRYLFCLTPFYLLLADGIFSFKKRQRVSLIIIFVIFNLVTSGYYLFNKKFQREDWKGLTGFVESKKVENSVTIFTSNSNMEAYLYYAPDAKIAGPAGVAKGYNQIWLMDYLSDIFDAGGATESNIEALGYMKKADYRFNGIGLVHLYENSY